MGHGLSYMLCERRYETTVWNKRDAVTSTNDVACLIYCTPQDPDTTRALLLEPTVICLGRLTLDQVEPPDAGHLQLDLPTISVRHARIINTDAGYVLQNWQGRYGIGLYERELKPGESHVLSHSNIFRLPAREEHVRLQFLVSQQQTLLIPVDVEHRRGKVYVFGEQVKLTPLEYRLVAYLHRHAPHLCSYDELMAALWGDANPYERKGNLEVLLHDVRAKLRAASGGFTFMETVRGQGVRMVV